jgi:cold shock CspA family protein
MAIENRGILKTWKDDRGFGFIKPDDGSDDIFIHISALKGFVRRPYRGDAVTYEIEHGSDGKSKAINARIEGVEVFSEEKASNKGIWIAVLVIIVIAVATGLYFGGQI